MRTIQHRQGIQTACIEEIAFVQGWISAEKARAAGTRLAKTNYGKAILKAVEDSPPTCATIKTVEETSPRVQTAE